MVCERRAWWRGSPGSGGVARARVTPRVVFVFGVRRSGLFELFEGVRSGVVVLVPTLGL